MVDTAPTIRTGT